MKKLTASLVLTAGTLLLSACGGGNEPAAPTTGGGGGGGGGGGAAPAPTATSAPLNVAIWDSFQEPGMRQIMNLFTEETGIEVNLDVVGWGQYWTMMDAAAQGGALPDVFWMHSDQFQRYADNAMLLDLSSFIANSSVIDLNMFYPDIVAMYNYSGRQYAIPKDIDTIALWYNRTIFEEVGIPTPDASWTWQTLADAARQITDHPGDFFGFAWSTDNTQDGFFNLIYSMGGYIINEDQTRSGLDNPNTIAALEFIVDELLPAMPSMAMMSENPPYALFPSGQLAMTTMGSWMVSNFAGNENIVTHGDVAVLPMANDGTRVSLYNGLGWSASANGENTYNAWRLIEWMGSYEMQQMQAQLGVTMAAIPGLSDDWAGAAPMFNLQAYLDMAASTLVFRPTSRNATVWQNMIETRFQEMWLGGAPADVLPVLAAEMNRMLEEERR